MDKQIRTQGGNSLGSPVKPKSKRGRAKAKESNSSVTPLIEAQASQLTPAGVVAKPTKATSSSKKRKKKTKPTSSSTPMAVSSCSDELETPKTKLKVVVRRLPPNVPEAVLWQAVAPWVREGLSQTNDVKLPTINWKKFVQGKLKDSSPSGTSNDPKAVAHVHSRAYLHFLSLEALLEFHRNFDGHVFRDAKGNEYTTIVEFAPHQKVPFEVAGRRKKEDAREGTIDEDVDYMEFLASLEERAAETDVGDDAQTTAEKTDAQLMAHLASRSAEASAIAAKARQTPLLEHLRAQRAGRNESSALAAARDYLTRSNPAYNVVSKTPADKGSKKKKGKSSATPGAPNEVDPSVSSATAAKRSDVAPATTPTATAVVATVPSKKKSSRQAKVVLAAQAPEPSSTSANTAQRAVKTKGTTRATSSKNKLTVGASQSDVKASGAKVGRQQRPAQRQSTSAHAPIAILKRAEQPQPQVTFTPPDPVAETGIPTGPRADSRGFAANGSFKAPTRRGGKGAGRGGKAVGGNDSSAAG